MDYSLASQQLAGSLARLEQVGDTGAVRHWYVASQPALILGRGQKPEQINLAACKKYGIQVLNRFSGGTAVLVGTHFLSLDVALPPDHPLNLSDVTESYRWFGETWSNALKSLHILTEMVIIEKARRQTVLDRSPEFAPHLALLKQVCFGTLSPYEITVQGRKLVGLSQLRRKQGTLLQAGIHLTFDRELMAELVLSEPEHRESLCRLLEERTVALQEISGNPKSEVQEIVTAFDTALNNLQNF
jgi:lipoate-protein ligase A